MAVSGGLHKKRSYWNLTKHCHAIIAEVCQYVLYVNTILQISNLHNIALTDHSRGRQGCVHDILVLKRSISTLKQDETPLCVT